MKTRLALTLALAALSLGLSGLARADDSLFTSKEGIEHADGASIYTHICQGCHMPGGLGAIGAGHYPKLAGDPKLSSWQYAAFTVLNGRNGMPPFGLPPDQVWETRTVHLSDEQVADVVNYIRTHFGNNDGEAITAAQVKALPHPSAPPAQD
ncbi:c-type cytochrome [Solimonas marina]|uniref:Cytochrome c n=1 Tax=Solimonas marina TaxID=2714601 RepID=A0A969WAH1_9GAMM|nr:cytochrome c [Solimonas marina]NKF23008.1 cytochrome c [Solimonas marina]